jgi:enamine deaminase RidA (YjgF/YER057c/UK114 family)
MSAEARLKALGLTLPAPVAPLANYLPFVRTGTLLFISGQLPMRDGTLLARGKLGAGITTDQGKEAARACALNILGQVRAAIGSLDAVQRVVRLGGFIAATPNFTDLALVMNGASDLVAEIFAETGRHARSTVGVPVLPADAPVEVEALFEVQTEDR